MINLHSVDACNSVAISGSVPLPIRIGRNYAITLRRDVVGDVAQRHRHTILKPWNCDEHDRRVFAYMMGHRKYVKQDLTDDVWLTHARCKLIIITIIRWQVS